jgi:hypothetical protein
MVSIVISFQLLLGEGSEGDDTSDPIEDDLDNNVAMYVAISVVVVVVVVASFVIGVTYYKNKSKETRSLKRGSSNWKNFNQKNNSAISA